MKSCVRVLSVALVAVFLLLTLTSCAPKVPEGEYILGDTFEGYYCSFTFKGDKFTYNTYRAFQVVEEESYSGKYTLVEDKEESEEGYLVGTITFTYTDKSGNEATAERSLVYDEGKGRLVIGDIIYTELY